MKAIAAAALSLATLATGGLAQAADLPVKAAKKAADLPFFLVIDDRVTFSYIFNASQPESDRSAELIIDVNGRAMRFLDGPKQEDFYLLALPVEYLKAGTNVITFHAPAGTGWRFPISLDEEYAKGSREHSSAPGRSAKSKDGGASWTKQLGVKESVRGEYGVRIFVNQYAAAGTVISPVLDAESLAEPALLPRPTSDTASERASEQGNAQTRHDRLYSSGICRRQRRARAEGIDHPGRRRPSRRPAAARGSARLARGAAATCALRARGAAASG